MKRSLDIASVIGPILAIGLVFYGIIMSTDIETKETTIVVANIMNFFDPPSIIIVVGGTFGCLLFMFPLSQFAKIPKHLKIIFLPTKYEPTKYIDLLVDFAKKAREKGLLSLEEDANNAENAFLRNGLQMIVDSVHPEMVKQELEAQLDNIDERHAQDCALYDKGASLGPAFGMIGTLIGLVNMLKGLSDVASVGPNMAVALVTTFYGSLLANVLFAPISNKLQARHNEEYLCMSIVCAGVQAIQSGENPKIIESRLLNLLSSYKQQKYTKRSSSN